MRSVKAILAGCVFIIVTLVIIQLAIVFLNVGYNSLAKYFPFLNEISHYFRYLVAYPVFFLVMFMGGYLTASLAQRLLVLHCLAVGVITLGVSMMAAADYMTVTLAGMLVVLLALLSTLAGGFYWQKKH